MKTTRILFIGAFLLLILSGCSFSTDVKFYFVSEQETPNALKKIGCEEYLVGAQESIFGEVSGETLISEALERLLSADPAAYGENLQTATAIKDGYFILESVEKRPMGTVDGFLVSLKKNPDVGIAGVCDVPRAKEQITETVRAAVGGHPFVIRLDGETRNWELFGSDQSGEE